MLFNTATGEFEKALQVVNDMKADGIVPHDAFFNATTAAAEQGDLDKALKILDVFRDCGIQPDMVTYYAMLNVFNQREQLDQSLKLFGEMSARGVPPDLKSYIYVLSLCERLKNFEVGFELVKKAIQEGFFKVYSDEECIATVDLHGLPRGTCLLYYTLL